jgi:ribosomal protein L4
MAFAMRQEAMACTSSRANPVAAANARRGAAARPARGARAPLGKAKVGQKLAGARLVRA